MKNEIGTIEVVEKFVMLGRLPFLQRCYILVVTNTKTHKRTQYGEFKFYDLAENFAKEHKTEVSYDE